MLTMPLFFYQTTLVWVDDDAFFIKVIADTFKREYLTKIFFSPKSFLDFFNTYEATVESACFLRSSNGDDDYEVNHRLPVEMDFQRIIDLYQNKNRIHDISVIIVDFKMPGLTGLELMQQIKSSAVKRILLTGEAEDQLAITAFNDNSIDRFVRKGDCNFSSSLNLYIRQVTTQYFCDLTKPLLTHLEAEYRLPQSDPVFIDFFDKWVCINNIVEYFVFDKNGSMLAVDQQGKLFYFVIHTEHSLEAFCELHNADKTVKLFINAIQKRHKIPFFGLFREAWEFEPPQWADHFYSPEILRGREQYYWRVVEG